MDDYFAKKRKVGTAIRLFSAKSTWNLVSQGLGGVLSFIGLIFVSRYCSPSKFATISIILAFLSISADLFDFGACSWGFRELSAHRIEVKDFFGIMLRRALFMLLIFPIGVALIYHQKLSWIYTLLILYPPLWIFTNYFQKYCLSKNLNSKASLIFITERAFWLAQYPLHVLGMGGDTAYFLSILGGLFLHCLLGTYLVLKLEGIGVIKKLSIRKFGSNKHIGLISLVSDLMSLDIWLVGLFSTLNTAGAYAITEKFRSPFLIGYTTFAVRVATVAPLRKKRELDKMWQSDKYLLYLNTLALILIAVLSKFFIHLLFGNKYQNLILGFTFSCIGMIFYGLSQVMGTFLVAMNKEKFVSRQTLIYVPSLLIFVAFGSRFYSTPGACLGFLFASFALFVSSLIPCSQSFKLGIR